MLTEEDFKQIADIVKKDREELSSLIVRGFDNTASKNGLIDLTQDVRDMRTSVDGLAKTFKDYHDEQKIQVHRLNRMEDWIKQAAAKLGLDYNS